MYKGTLIAVKNIEESKKFYHDILDMNVVPSMPGGKDLAQKYKSALALEPEFFEERWSAD